MKKRRNADDRLQAARRAFENDPTQALRLYVERNRAGLCAICGLPMDPNHDNYVEQHKDANIKICVTGNCAQLRVGWLLQEGAIAFGENDWHALYGDGAKAPKGFSKVKGMSSKLLSDGLVLAYISLTSVTAHAAAMRMYQQLHGEINLQALEVELDADTELTIELEIHSDNTRQLYDWDRKIQVGALKALRGLKKDKLYDRLFLHKAYLAFVNEVSRSYSKEYGGGGLLGDAGDRRFCAWRFVAHFERLCLGDAPDLPVSYDA